MSAPGRHMGRHLHRFRKEPRDERLCLRLNPFEVLAVAKTLRVQLVDVLRTRRPHGKPSIVSDYFQPTDRFPIARRGRQDRADGVARSGRDRLSEQPQRD